MLDDGEPVAEQTEAGDDEVRSTGKLLEHDAGIAPVGRLAVEVAVEMDGGIDPERDAVGMDGACLPLGVGPHERDRIRIRRVVLHIRRRHDLVPNAQLLQDRSALRRRRSEDEPRRHPSFFATQISSAGHARDHSTENDS